MRVHTAHFEFCRNIYNSDILTIFHSECMKANGVFWGVYFEFYLRKCKTVIEREMLKVVLNEILLR